MPNLAQIYLKECLIQAKCCYGFIFQYLATMETNMTQSDPYPQNHRNTIMCLTAKLTANLF